MAGTTTNFVTLSASALQEMREARDAAGPEVGCTERIESVFTSIQQAQEEAPRIDTLLDQARKLSLLAANIDESNASQETALLEINTLMMQSIERCHNLAMQLLQAQSREQNLQGEYCTLHEELLAIEKTLTVWREHQLEREQLLKQEIASLRAQLHGDNDLGAEVAQ